MFAPLALVLGVVLGHVAAVAHTGRVVDERGLDFATQRGFDSYVPTLYNDPANCTIGYGHLVHLGPCVFNRAPSDALGGAAAYARQLADEMPYLSLVDGRLVKRRISKQEARALLRRDARKTDAIVNRRFKTPLGQNQYDALWDFTFNGCLRGGLGRKLIAAVNRRDFETAVALIPRCNKGVNRRGKLVVLGGLVRRRAAEVKLFDTPDEPTTTTTTTTSTTSTTDTATCSADELSRPPSPGCYRVKVRVILDKYPGDPQGHLGVGVGSATVQPGGKTITCLNPGDAAACFVYDDVAVNTTVTVTATPGSESPDPATPADSAFEKFAGSCTGTGDCVLTPSSNNTVVSVHFRPAVATLTLRASVSTAEMSANGEGHVASTLPVSPVRCGPGSANSFTLPCSLMVRINGEVQVQSDNQGRTPTTPTFSDNCAVRPAAPDYCDITLTSDQTVIATYGG